MGPAAAAIVASAISAGSKAAGQASANRQAKKAAKLRAKETHRETEAMSLNEALQRNAELTAHGLSSRNKLGKRRAQSLQETADLIRGAFKI
jgi:hypothetical protein